MAKVHRICSVDGCDKCSAAFGYCLQHYRRFKRHGDPLGGRSWPKSRKRPEPKICKFEGCERRTRALGFCIKHYSRVWKTGSVEMDCTEPGALSKWLMDHASYGGDDCLKWPFAVAENGYGICGHGAGKTTASREMCRIAHGEPPSEKHHAAHTCGNGHLSCVNPKHLRWATPVENEADKTQHGTRINGERHYRAKLGAADVIEIRRLAGTASSTEIAKSFPVTPRTIRDIISRKSWHHLP